MAICSLHTDNHLLEKNRALETDNEAMKVKDATFEKKFAEMTAKNADMEKAYRQLMSKVDGLATELASLKEASQK